MQHDFQEMRGGSKAVWNFSKNSSILVTSPVHYWKWQSKKKLGIGLVLVTSHSCLQELFAQLRRYSYYLFGNPVFSVAAILSGIFKIDDVNVMAKLAKKTRIMYLVQDRLTKADHPSSLPHNMFHISHLLFCQVLQKYSLTSFPFE